MTMSSDKSSSSYDSDEDNKVLYRDSPNITAYEDTSITPELKTEADRLARKLQQVSLDPIRSIMESDPNAVLETMMEDGEPSSGSLFMMKTPIAKTPQLPTSSCIPRLEDVKIARWYPHQSDQSFEGKMTSEYLSHLKRAKIFESESFFSLQAAEKLSRNIGCSRTILLWTTLNPILTQIGNLRLPEIASDIAGYLYDDPDSVFPYLKCLNRVKTLLVNPAKFATLEDRITQMISLMESTISAAENHQEESLKFATQVSNVSTNLAGLQEVFEKTIIKVKKLDLLPDTSSLGPSGISIPSSAPRHQGQRVVTVDLSVSGEYSGLYTFKASNGRITSIVPPKVNPEVGQIIDLPPDAQTIFVNLDQVDILNRLASKPELKKAFTLATLKERAPFLRILCKGMSERTNQWTRVELYNEGL